ncbi:MAG: hypothetical protein CSA22_09965 [Deltaproteobacteria bacterium]|nr:MAG: hypothetical protein CSA22_09965 [Deltaproteobacteria bacterium]
MTVQSDMEKVFEKIAVGIRQDPLAPEPSERWHQDTLRQIRNLPAYGENRLETVWMVQHFWKVAPVALWFIVVLAGLLAAQDFTVETALAMQFFGISSGMEYLAYSGML